jgi:hypothetical protein
VNCDTNLYIYQIKAILIVQFNILDAHIEIWIAQIYWTACLEYAMLGSLEAKPPEATILRFNDFDTISRSFSAISDKFRSCTVFRDGRGRDKVP